MTYEYGFFTHAPFGLVPRVGARPKGKTLKHMYDHYIYNSYDEVQYISERCELQKDVKFTVSAFLAFFATLALYAPIATA